MSNPLKAVGKVFKKVVKVVKKYALPIIAIGAVVLTGGAALGILPALGGAGGLLAGIGIKGALAGVLVGAAKAATFGAIAAGVTGGNIIKGATTGLITGGALGGLSAALGGGAAAAGAGAGGQAASAVANTAANAPGAVAGAAGNVAHSAIQSVGSVASNAASSGLSAASGIAGSAGIVGSAALPVSSAGGIGGFISQNPTLVGSAIQGLGSGLGAKAQSKEDRRALDLRRASYLGIGDALYSAQREETDGLGPLLAQGQAPVNGGKVRYDRATGQLVAVG